MVIDHGHRLGITRLQPFAAARMIRAVDEDGGTILRVPQDLVRAQKDHAGNQKLEPARHDIGVDADDVAAPGLEHAGERHLGTDAIAVGTRMADDSDLSSGQRSEQPGELRREFGIKFLHGQDAGSSGLGSSGLGSSAGGAISSIIWRIRAPRIAV